MEFGVLELLVVGILAGGDYCQLVVVLQVEGIQDVVRPVGSFAVGIVAAGGIAEEVEPAVAVGGIASSVEDALVAAVQCTDSAERLGRLACSKVYLN